jgi:hypothetical protein
VSNEQTGWVGLQGQLIGNLESYSMAYYWDGVFYPTREEAIAVTMKRLDHDDFNLAHVESAVMTWFGWMDEKHPEEDWSDVAEQFGWRVSEVSR